MPSSEMLRRVALVRTDVSYECIDSIIRVTRIGQLRTTLAVTNNRSRTMGNYQNCERFCSKLSSDTYGSYSVICANNEVSVPSMSHDNLLSLPCRALTNDFLECGRYEELCLLGCYAVMI
jgi:hypothetical protein